MKNTQLLIGNLGKDPELSVTQTDKKVCKFSVAVTEKYNNAEETNWFNCVAWNKQAELCEKYLKKGSKVAVMGKTVNRVYDATDGSRRYVSEVIIREITFLSSPSNDQDDDSPF